MADDMTDPFGMRLDMALARKGQNDAGLARILKVSRAYISEVRKDRRDGVNRGESLIRRMALALEVDPDWLLTGKGLAPPWAAPHAHPHTWAHEDQETSDYRVPVIGSAAANDGARVDGYEATGEELAIRPQWQAIRIYGDSGEPVVLKGQTVLVDPTVPVEEGRLVVAFTDDGPVLKRFVGIQAGKMFLASVNHGKGSLIVDAEGMPMPLVVVGVVFTDSVAR